MKEQVMTPGLLTLSKLILNENIASNLNDQILTFDQITYQKIQCPINLRQKYMF